jgi:hypothetical protein
MVYQWVEFIKYFASTLMGISGQFVMGFKWAWFQIQLSHLLAFQAEQFAYMP